MPIPRVLFSESVHFWLKHLTQRGTLRRFRALGYSRLKRRKLSRRRQRIACGAANPVSGNAKAAGYKRRGMAIAVSLSKCGIGKRFSRMSI